MHRRRSLWLLPALALAGTLVAGSPALAQDPEELEFVFVPSVEAGALVDDIQPLTDYLTQELGIPVSGVVSSSYVAAVEAMRAGQSQIGALPPLGLVQAVDLADAEVILQTVRFGSPTYHTQFFTNNPDKYCVDEPQVSIRRDQDEAGEYVYLPFLNCNGTRRAFYGTPLGPTGVEALEGIEPGSTVAFTRPGSSSGFIFPAIVFMGMGMDPQTDLNPLFAEQHERTVIAVCNGQAEVGVSFDDARPQADELTDCDVASNVVVFAYGPEIANDGFVVSGDLSEDLQGRIKQALLDYADTEQGAKDLDEIYNINGLAEANVESLQVIREAVEKLGFGQD